MQKSGDEEYEDHEEHHQHNEYLHHQPPIRRNAVEVLQELALRSLHVVQCVIHVFINSVRHNTNLANRKHDYDLNAMQHHNSSLLLEHRTQL
jgi:hypothetical protein